MSGNKRIRRRKIKIIKTVVLGDIHFPFQSKKCISLFLSFIRWLQPDNIIFNGDLVDFYPLSRFDKDPARITSLQDELDEALQFLRSVRKIVPKAELLYMEGNHENRLRKWLSSHPEVSSLRALALPALLEFEELDIAFIEYEDFLFQFGFIIHHGEVVRKNSCYTAKAMIETWKSSGISNHTHRLGTYHISSFGFDGVWHENGCMCSLNPEYIHGVPDWQHGFSVINWNEEKGESNVETIKIFDEGFFYRDNYFRLDQGENS